MNQRKIVWIERTCAGCGDPVKVPTIEGRVYDDGPIRCGGCMP